MKMIRPRQWLLVLAACLLVPQDVQAAGRGAGALPGNHAVASKLAIEPPIPQERRNPKVTKSGGNHSPGASVPRFAELVLRVRHAKLDVSSFPGALVGGGLYGGQLLITALEPDPLMPDTLDVYFDEWNATARAHLLISYARATVATEHPPVYAALSNIERAEQEARDADERSRINRIVKEGNYATEWSPFVDAYRSFLPEATKKARDAAPGPPSFDQFTSLDPLAREKGLHRLIESIRIEPEHVVSEMLRIVDTDRQRAGLDAAEVPPGMLFYWCDPEEPPSQTGHLEATENLMGGVRIRIWHPLAPAFIRAWTAQQEGRPDPQAKRIMDVYKKLTADFSTWLARNPESDTTTREEKLRKIATDLGLIELLESYARQSSTEAERSQ